MNWLTIVLAARDDAPEFVRSVDGAVEHSVELPASDLLDWANLERVDEVRTATESAFVTVGPGWELDRVFAGVPTSDEMVQSFTVALPVGEDRIVYLPDDIDEQSQTVQLFTPTGYGFGRVEVAGEFDGWRAGYLFAVTQPPTGHCSEVVGSEACQENNPATQCDCARRTFPAAAAAVGRRIRRRGGATPPRVSRCWCNAHSDY